MILLTVSSHSPRVLPVGHSGSSRGPFWLILLLAGGALCAAALVYGAWVGYEQGLLRADAFAAATGGWPATVFPALGILGLVLALAGVELASEG